MKTTYSLILVGVMALVPVTRAATVNVTTDAATGAGSLTAAINALNDGDTIAFNIPPGAGEVHYIQVPPDGFPLITKNNITVDGYTQPGASANTASIHAANNAALKIVITATNGNALSMDTACATSWGAGADWGYGDGEQAILGFFHATNAVVRGLVIQATPFTATTQAPPDPTFADPPVCKSICFAAVPYELGGFKCENWRVSGCWFGVDPVTKQVAYCQDVYYGQGTLAATPAICIASYRSRNAVSGSETNWNYNWPGTIGVAAKSASPRADFNVFVTSYGYDSEGHDYRVSGNFWNVLPDGVTAADMSVLGNPDIQQGDGYFECGRNAANITFGTDGDGVNDDQEGNVCGPFVNGGSAYINIYSVNLLETNMVIAGNYLNADINGKTFGTNLALIVDEVYNTATLRFGSDFNGVSDAAEGNLVFNSSLLAVDGTWPTNTAWISMRGNAMTNCTSAGASRPPIGDANTEGFATYANFVDPSSSIIPVIGGTTTASSLSGTCGLPLYAPYTNLMVDLYEADPNAADQPQGMRWIAAFADNSAADSDPAVGAFTFSTAGLGLTSGMKVTIAVTYASYTRPTIASVSRTGTQSTVTISNPGAGTYGIQKSSGLSSASWSSAGATVGGIATFTDTNSPASFYQAVPPTAMGQTVPFSEMYTIP